MDRLANFVTDFGDSAVIVPLAGATMVLIVAARQPRLALGWGGTVAGCAAIIGVLKLVLGACGRQYGIPALTSPSGHTAMTAVAYGGLALLVAGSLGRAARRAVYAGTAALILGVAASRLVLGVHSMGEVVLGLAIGLGALEVFRRIFMACPPFTLPVRWLAATALVVIVLAHGNRLQAERAIRDIAGSWFVHMLLPGCR